MALPAAMDTALTDLTTSFIAESNATQLPNSEEIVTNLRNLLEVEYGS